MPSAIARAIAFADMPDHEGAGYTLLIRETCGALVEVDVYRHPVKGDYSKDVIVLRVRNPDHKPDLMPDGAEYFPEHISSVTILW